MASLGQKIKRHWPALAVALLFGLLMASPFLFFEYKLGPAYQGIQRTFADDESFYLARVQDVVDGHPFLANAYLWEHKAGLPQQSFLAEFLLAVPMRVFHLSINGLHIVGAVVLSAIIFALIYAMFYILTRRRWSAILLSVFLTFGLFVMSLVRPISPQFNFIFWLSLAILLWRSLS